MGEVNSNDDAHSSPPQSDRAAIGTGAALRTLATALADDVRRLAGSLRPAAAAMLATQRSPRRSVGLGTAIARTAKGAAVLVLVGVAGLAALAVWSVHDVPLERGDTSGREAAIVIEAANGEPLGRRGPLRLADAPLEAFPDHLVEAVVSIEDRRFHSHWGVDPRAVLRSLRRNIAAGKVVEGGSTITQQLVKQMLDDDERTFRRKGREALVAIWLEFQLSKDEILTRYLNRTYMGAGAYGMPAAARLYFSKDVGELTLAESAMLAGVIRSPSQLNPLRNLAAARQRASVVLATMVENGFIDRETAEAARAEPATPAPAAIRSEDGGWFADWIAEEAIDLAGASHAGGLRVRTTLVPELQEIAERIVRDALDESGADSRISEAALVALAPDGAVLAMVGGRDYGASQFNRAVQAARQPGSAFKPFIYLAALRHGFSLGDAVEDAPIEVDGWQPENFGGDYRGSVTLSEAFARSLNTAAVRLALAVGIDEVARAARDLGIDAPLTGTPSLALGASEVSLLDLTGAYASLRAGEGPIEPWGVAAFGAEGRPRLVTTGPSLNERRPIGPQHADMIALLRSVVERGTGRAAALPGFAAGKTGTSQNYRDAWFIGFNEAMVVGVWVGNDDGEPMNEITGGSVPSVIWRSFMMEAAPLVDDRPNRSDGQVVALKPDESVAGRCDYRACSARYRSFRAADCSYQPYGGGPRRVCPLSNGVGSVARAGVPRSQESVMEAGVEPLVEPAAIDGRCDVAACAARYSSFRASDCTYQPFDGPRRVCGSAEVEFGGMPPRPEDSVDLEADHPPVEADHPQAPPEPRRLFGGLFSIFGGGSRGEAEQGSGGCNFDACAAKYGSFDPASCSYQPLDGGPRRACSE